MARFAAIIPFFVLVAALVSADPDAPERRAPAGLAPFPVSIRYTTIYWYFQTPNVFQTASSGQAYRVPDGPGPWEVDVLECAVLSSAWAHLRGNVTYLASTTSPLEPVPTAEKYEINGYIYPRDGQPEPNEELRMCHNEPEVYWAKPYMAKARQTFRLPRGVTRFVVSHHPLNEEQVMWNKVRFRSAPETCISSAGNYFVPKDKATTAANAGRICASFGGALADVTANNIAEINALARRCQGGNKKFHVAGWNGYDYGLGSMLFTSSSSASGSTGAVTIPDGGTYMPVCSAVKDKLRRIMSENNDIVLFTSGELMDYNQGKALCNAENRDLLNLNAPAATLTEQQKDSTPWYRVRTMLFNAVGKPASAFIGSFNGDPFLDAVTGARPCIAFFTGANTAAEIGTVSVPAGGCEGSKANGVLCGPIRAGEPVRRSEL